MDLLKQTLENERVILDLKAQDQHTIFHEVIKTAVEKQLIPAALAETVEVGPAGT